ncbi:YegS/Rv2252/BmrU family lipid kinase [Intestinibacillus massiliensis]|nr:YegS/Rv2252/BmrU family lipid kinase [Intestinibacillus massiliensis]
MDKLLWIVNPHSGSGAIREDMMDCIDIFCKAGYEPTVYLTQGPQDACRIAREESHRFDRIVCCGGDGTLDEVVNGLMACENPPPLGYIPGGTTNDMANSLGIPKYPEDAAKIAAHGRPFPMDVGRFNDRYFTYIAAFGAFTGVSYSTPQPYKSLFGHAAYVLEGIRTLPTIKAYPIEVEAKQAGISLAGDFIYGMVTNTTSVGGIIGVAPEEVEMDDGLFEVLLVRQPENPMQLQGIISMLLAQDMRSELIVHFKADRVCFKAQGEMPWTLDGEYGGAPQQVEIENCKRALTLLVEDV